MDKVLKYLFGAVTWTFLLWIAFNGLAYVLLSHKAPETGRIVVAVFSVLFFGYLYNYYIEKLKYD